MRREGNRFIGGAFGMFKRKRIKMSIEIIQPDIEKARQASLVEVYSGAK